MNFQSELADARAAIVDHPLYAQIRSAHDLRIFMQHHVFAVWDFMSLLKGLQQQLTCVQTPWVPVGNANTRFLINEIVVGEESDVDAHGKRTSHFEMYLEAMKQCGANVSSIQSLIAQLNEGKSVNEALKAGGAPQSVCDFVNYTFEVIRSGKPHVMAAVFTFGREDLIPDMFLAMVRDLSTSEAGKFEGFKYYLERHIEVDGDHHSHLALEMTQELCGGDTDKWQEALEASRTSLHMRKHLWDGCLKAIEAASPVVQH